MSRRNDWSILVDGDMTLYKAASATEVACDWGDDVWVLSANLQEAKDLIENTLNDLKDRFDSDKLTICLSDPTGANFRIDINPEYKSHRKGTRKPLIYPKLREWLIEDYGAVWKPRLEGDDLLGLLATYPLMAGTPVIVSDDKDMLTLPVTVYRLDELIHVDKESADRNWFSQTLTGDPTDGYKGCPGVGPVGAEKILGKEPTFKKVVAAFENKGCTYDDALMNARMARILRHGDWDEDKQSVKLWIPEDGSVDAHGSARP